jgi:glycosyltransferase involved in cell wall biosynthesis
VTERTLQFVVPGDLSAATGGYHYDRRIIEGLRALGWSVAVHALDSSFPFPTSDALARARAVFEALPDGALVMVDGLAFGAMPEVVAVHARRLRLVALIHHPLAMESGLAPAHAEHLLRSEKSALRAARHVIVTSAATREALFSYDVGPDRISTVEPGTDEAPLATGNESGTLEMLCVANVIPRKGYDLLIEALTGLQQYAWRLTCVGNTTRSPETIDALRRQLNDAVLNERVRFVGESSGDELESYYHTADLFVLPTRYEGFGMVVAEALARGLPVVATQTGAIAQLVPSDAGVLVPPENSHALREALARVLSKPGFRASLAEGARLVRSRLTSWPQACANAAGILDGVSRQ